MPVRRRAHHGGYPWSMSQLQGKDGVAIPVYDMGKPGHHAERAIRQRVMLTSQFCST